MRFSFYIQLEREGLKKRTASKRINFSIIKVIKFNISKDLQNLQKVL